jgi:glucan phosphoethanolaminetransferase (alkaline phosphatase superfamily)
MGGFLGSGITGVILIYIINLSISLVYREGITYWHVELSLLMVIAVLIHFHIYRKPFKNMFKVLFPFKSRVNKNKSSKNMGNSR